MAGVQEDINKITDSAATTLTQISRKIQVL